MTLFDQWGAWVFKNPLKFGAFKSNTEALVHSGFWGLVLIGIGEVIIGIGKIVMWILS